MRCHFAQVGGDRAQAALITFKPEFYWKIDGDAHCVAVRASSSTDRTETGAGTFDRNRLEENEMGA
jgi:hypothetical protein